MRTITTLFFALGLMLSTLLACAQSKADRIYDTFEDQDGISCFTFTKNMTDAFNIDLGDDGEEKNVSGDLNQIRFLSYNPEKGKMSGESFIRKAVSMLPSQYKKFEDEDNDSDAEVWLLGGKKKYSECHIFIRNDNPDGNCFLVSFYGNFLVNDLKKLKEKSKDFSN
ncbi:MAG TPA: DUF4252 domain-containing protein [Draconibacterium sp.]|nr:DUF4252 domain-containing protein [Draconibacterium sp.]